MKAGELVEGAKYILKQAGDPVAVYEGRHDGKLILADGATFYGGNGALRFRYTDATGIERVALLQSGAEVSEPEATRTERERLAAEREARLDAAQREATEFLVSLGFEVSDRYGAAHSNPNCVLIRYRKEDANLIEIDNFTIGKLRTALKVEVEFAKLRATLAERSTGQTA